VSCVSCKLPLQADRSRIDVALRCAALRCVALSGDERRICGELLAGRIVEADLWNSAGVGWSRAVGELGKCEAGGECSQRNFFDYRKGAIRTPIYLPTSRTETLRFD
jgi:hypothetical protein